MTNMHFSDYYQTSLDYYITFNLLYYSPTLETVALFIQLSRLAVHLSVKVQSKFFEKFFIFLPHLYDEHAGVPIINQNTSNKI